MLKTVAVIIVLLLVVVVGAVLAYAATKPDVFHVRRSASIKAPPEKIFPLINDFRSWSSWSPYEHKDPAMKRTVFATAVTFLVTSRPVHHPLRAVLNTPRVSLRPTPDGALAVDSDWANAHITRAADGSYAVSPSIIDALLAEASLVLQGTPRLEAAWCGIGPKPVPGDGESVFGRVDDVSGLYLAFTHSGATLGLIAGELLAYEITTSTPHPMLEEFNVRRFRESGASGASRQR